MIERKSNFGVSAEGRVEIRYYSIEMNQGGGVWRPFQRLARMDEGVLVRRCASVLTRVDPLMKRDHSRRVRAVLAEEYAQMAEQEPGFLRLMGVTDLALNHVVGLSYDTGHYYAARPDVSPGERLGLWVFLHGNAGNFKLMPWRWWRLAEEMRLAVIVPTCGFGFWGGKSAEFIRCVVDDALRRWPEIDVGRGQWLAGLSDGGNGVTRGALVRDWDGLVYLSATMREKELTQPRFMAKWRDRRVLVLHGGADHNVRPKSVERAVKCLRDGGVKVDHSCYDREDHFMTFGAAREVDERIRAWIDESRTGEAQ